MSLNDWDQLIDAMYQWIAAGNTETMDYRFLQLVAAFEKLKEGN